MNRKTLLTVSLIWLASIALAFWSGSRSSSDKVADTTQGKVDGTHRGGRQVGSGYGGGSSTRSSKNTPPWKDGRESSDGASFSDASMLARLDAVLSTTNALDRTRGFLDLIETLDSAGMALAAERLSDSRDRSARWQHSLLMYAWARKAPEEALAWADEKGSGRARYSILSSWAEVSPDQAISWATANAPMKEDGTPEENWGMLGVVHGLAKTNVGSAARAVEMMNFGRARGDALEVVMREMWKSDSGAVKNWVTSIKDERLLAGAASRVASRLADSNVQEAATWSQTLSTPEARSRAYAEVIDRWAREDPNKAGAWINQFPQSEEMDRAREEFADRVDKTDPQSAIAWASSIVNTQRRDGAVYDVARDWMRRDRAAAQAYIRSDASLPARVKRMAR